MTVVTKYYKCINQLTITLRTVSHRLVTRWKDNKNRWTMERVIRSVNWKTDHTKPKIKNTQKVNDKQTLHSKLMIKPHYVLRKGKLFLLHNATCRDTLVTNPVIKYEWGMDRMVIKTNWTYLWSFLIQTCGNG
jgi:hypothetical protein